MNCAGCDTHIPQGASNCPMCGAKVARHVPECSFKLDPPPRPIIQPVTEIHHHHHSNSKEQPVLIEATGKKWKKCTYGAAYSSFWAFRRA